MKLGAISVGVGALQLAKVYLMTVEADEEEQRRRRQRNLGHRQSEEERAREKGLAANMDPQTRRALITMIDDFMTPVLVDQWRLGLVKVLLDPENGPVLPEEDPDLREGLLESLQAYQASQDRQPTFTPGAVPSRYATSSQPPRHSQPSGSGVQQPVTQPQPPLTSGGGAADDAHSGAVLSTDGASGVASPPTAPPLYPTVQHPSSPLMADPMYSKAGSSRQLEEPPEECGVCLDAPVDVKIDNCTHKLCCECAKAICCLEGRAPQCPFCRGAMTGVSAI